MWLESRLKRGLKDVLTQEELPRYQKSRRDWIAHGDRNTSSFHRKTISRRRHNRIEAIKNSEGNWLYDADATKMHAVHYFSNFFLKIRTRMLSTQLFSLFLTLMSGGLVIFVEK